MIPVNEGSLISNKEILAKVSSGSSKKLLSKKGYYFYIYKVTCLINGLVYIGCLATKKDPAIDKHYGEGTRAKKSRFVFSKGSRTLGSEFNKYGSAHFIREDLLFFESHKEMVKAMCLIVDESFVSDSRTLNDKAWVPKKLYNALEAKREIFSDLQNNVTSHKGFNHELVILIDCHSKIFESEIVSSLLEIEMRYSYAEGTVSKMLSEKNYMILEDRFLLLRLKDYFKEKNLKVLIWDLFGSIKNTTRKRFVLFQFKQGFFNIEFDQLKAVYPEMNNGNLRQLVKQCIDSL